MANTLTATVTIARDGTTLPGFPITRRLTVDEFQSFVVEQANNDGVFISTPHTLIADVRFYFLTPTQNVKILVNGNSDPTATLDLNANGLLLIVNGALVSGAGTNVSVENDSGNTAILTGLAGGT